MKNDENQRSDPERLGGITGRGFMPGQSGNPSDRPRTRGLLGTLRVRVSEIESDGRSLEDRLVDVLLQGALRGRHRLAAVEVIFDRLEGRSTQQIQVAVRTSVGSARCRLNWIESMRRWMPAPVCSSWKSGVVEPVASFVSQVSDRVRGQSTSDPRLLRTHVHSRNPI